MEDLKSLMRQNYLKYASYVILDRAIPALTDGLKPVQRRILYTLWKMDDGKLHKVANVAGQTMALHPHGDAAIIDALVYLSNKGYLLDQQGNFGNLLTGDPAAAARYIETRLLPLAKEVLFNPDLTETLPSYDGRNQEPVFLPAKIPLVLLQGASGIAVGMSTHILPHNFVELLEAEIALLEGEEVDVLPDFPTGGLMDASEYDQGRGKVRLRAKLNIVDQKTIKIEQICYGTTTESLIRSIDEAAKKGKIKIESISDYTADKVDIEIKLSRGQYAEELIEPLYAYTDCEISLNPQMCVIKEGMPWIGTTSEMLKEHVALLQGYLKRELEIERDRLLEKMYIKTLEQIFIENRLYKDIETVKKSDLIDSTVETSLVPFHSILVRTPTKEDRDHLLRIPIRRISLFDLSKNQEELAALEAALKEVEKHLKNIKKFTIHYIKGLIKNYGQAFPRQTRIGSIEQLDLKKIATKTLRVGVDFSTGFVGTSLGAKSKGFECTNFDKLLIFYADGTYQVENIPDKKYIHKDGVKAIWAGPADKKTLFNVVYKDPKTHFCYAKRFAVAQYILDKEYRFFEPKASLEYFSTEEAPRIELKFIPKVKQKLSKMDFSFGDILVKGVSAKGIRMAHRAIKSIRQVK